MSWACGSRKPAEERPAANPAGEPDDRRVVLRAGAVSYPDSAFSRYVWESIGDSVQELDAETLSQLFDQFVDDMILLQAADEQGVVLTTEEKRAFLEKAEPGTWTEEEKAALLAAESGPVIDKMKIQKYVREMSRDIGVSEEEVRAYYQGHADEFSLPGRVQVSQVLEATESDAVELWEKLRQQAEAVDPEAGLQREIVHRLEAQCRQSTRLTNHLHNLLARVFPELALIAPDLQGHGSHAAGYGFHPHWMDLAAPITLGGIWMALFVRELRSRPLLTPGDPDLQEMLEGERA